MAKVLFSAARYDDGGAWDGAWPLVAAGFNLPSVGHNVYRLPSGRYLVAYHVAKSGPAVSGSWGTYVYAGTIRRVFNTLADAETWQIVGD